MPAPPTALIQINPTVGALKANAELIAESARRAAAQGAQLIVFPELVLCGYPPEDLILRPHFLQDCARQIERLKTALPAEAFTVVGAPVAEDAKRFNAALVFHGGNVIGTYRKMLLPNYGVFDEKRVFDAGTQPFAFDVFGTKTGLHICEDSWQTDGEACRALAAEKPDLVVNLSASPYHRGKRIGREEVFATAARAFRAPLCFCNLIGGQDELVFDGGSMMLDADGIVTARGPLFQEYTLLNGGAPAPASTVIGSKAPSDPLEEVYEALKLGLRDYVNKNRFRDAVVAVSGGIDSALVLALACDALGAERVTAVTMPSQYSSEATLSDAGQIAANFGVELKTIPIGPLFERFTASLRDVWGESGPGLAEENLQARIRGTLIMALSNKLGSLVLTTGNKSEFATGYCTLYGDMAGGFAVIKDVPKTLVFELCRWRNAQGGAPLIPVSTIERPPSAELRPDQKDTDSLPPYEVLDPVLEAYVEKDMGIDAMIQAGFDEAAVRNAVRLVDRSEYKRRQGPPGIKITPKAFGRDRRMPVTNRYGG